VSSLLTHIQLANKQVVYKELKLKQYKTILKCLIGDTVNIYNLLLNLNNILTEITNLTKEDILNLNLLEYLLLLTEIRITSIGSSIFAVSKTENSSLNIEIPLYKTLDEIKKCLENYTPFKSNNLNYRIPSVKNILDKKTFLYIEQDVNDLPVKYLKIINNDVKKFNNYFDQYYFFNPSNNKKYIIKLSINLNEYIKLIKILYNENLLSIYDNIFYLSKICNISAEYLENCTYGEFKIFVKKTEQILQKNTKPTTPNVESELPKFDQIDINSLYGNDDIADISPSEFTP
jgi:hypothetical protein